MSEQKYVDLRLSAFWERRKGNAKEAAKTLKKADKVWTTLTRKQKSWANKELMVQVMAAGMNTINETYGW